MLLPRCTEQEECRQPEPRIRAITMARGRRTSDYTRSPLPGLKILVSGAEPLLPQPQISEDGEHDNHDTDDVEDVSHGCFSSCFRTEIGAYREKEARNMPRRTHGQLSDRRRLEGNTHQ